MKYRLMNHITLMALIVTPFSVIASDKNGDYWDADTPSPIEYPYISNTATLQGSVIGNPSKTEYVYEAVDAEGRKYDAYINTVTGEVTAVTTDAMVANVLTASQRATVKRKYEAAEPALAAAGGAAITAAVPVLVAALMCYINDNITKHRAHKECKEEGGTVVMENSGICGFYANYRCDRNPTPRPQPEPLPVPIPDSDPRYSRYGWTLPGSTNISSQFQLVVNTYDSDWFR